MSCNILSAILNISTFRNNNLKDYSSTYLNRINAVGEQLEFYIKDALAGSFNKKQEEKETAYNHTFSYLGNQNNPPDLIIKNGDAFEVKKIENQGSSLALNSSPPKDKLYNSDKRITAECKNCENKPWKEKDFFYVIGYAKKGVLNYLFFIQGTCYAAKKETYEKVHSPLKSEINATISKLGLEQGTTIELGKIRRVDPLGLTELRIRGMWSIRNPIKVYSSICNYDFRREFSLFALIEKQKYYSFPKEDITKIENSKTIKVSDLKIKDPNNPAKLIDAKLISFSF